MLSSRSEDIYEKGEMERDGSCVIDESMDGNDDFMILATRDFPPFEQSVRPDHSFVPQATILPNVPSVPSECKRSSDLSLAMSHLLLCIVNTCDPVPLLSFRAV